MSLNSFFKNLFGAGDEVAEAVSDATDASTGKRNENLSGRSFKKQLEETGGAVLLDVRTASEFSGGSIPGAKNIDFLSAGFEANISKLDKDATYFVFCRSGNRSAQACKIMHKKGYDVRNLSGGIAAFPF